MSAPIPQHSTYVEQLRYLVDTEIPSHNQLIKQRTTELIDTPRESVLFSQCVREFAKFTEEQLAFQSRVADIREIATKILTAEVKTLTQKADKLMDVFEAMMVLALEAEEIIT